MNIPESILNALTDEQKKKIETAKTPEEFLAIAKETGYELSEEQLNAMAGGWCPDCANNDPIVPGPCGPDFQKSCSPYCDALV